MEDTLREQVVNAKVSAKDIVLILVLMEDTLRVPDGFTFKYLKVSLNPCFKGRYSQRLRYK